MPTITVASNFALDIYDFDLSYLFEGETASASGSEIVVDIDADRWVFNGSGFTFDEDPRFEDDVPVTGTVTSIEFRTTENGGGLGTNDVVVSGISVAATDIVDAIADQTGDTSESLVRGLFSGNDTVTGGDLNDTLAGESGDDDIDSGRGDDEVDGDDGNDDINLGKGDDVAAGGRDNDTIAGGGGDDTIRGNKGDDDLSGQGGRDSIAGDGGDDAIEGGDKNDTLSGGAGNDTLRGDAGNDQMAGDDDNDVLRGGLGDDSMDGGLDDDTLRGDEGEDFLEGDKGRDSLRGGADDDVLIGGQGRDTLFGDQGGDTFVFATNSGKDIISDYEAGVDSIDLTDFGLNQTQFDAQANFALKGGGSKVQMKLDNLTVVFKGVTDIDDIDQGDFIL